MASGRRIKPPYKDIGYDRLYNTDRHFIKELFDLIRGEAIYYIAIVNLTFCGAARYCEFLRCNSYFYYYSEITNRLFRINAHIIPISVILVFGIINMGSAATAYAILVIALIIFFILTFFLSYHLSKADVLLIATYTD